MNNAYVPPEPWYDGLDAETIRYIRSIGCDKLPASEAARVIAVKYRQQSEYAHMMARQ